MLVAWTVALASCAEPEAPGERASTDGGTAHQSEGGEAEEHGAADAGPSDDDGGRRVGEAAGEGEGEGEGPDSARSADVGTGEEPECVQGCLLWQRALPGPGDDDLLYAEAGALAVDSRGGPVVSAIVGGEGDQRGNLLLRRFSIAGDLGSTHVHALEHQIDVAGTAVGPDDSAVLIATEWTILGDQRVTDGGDDILIVAETRISIRKFASDGIELWTRTSEREGPQNDIAAGVAVDGTGDVLVAGTVRTDPVNRSAHNPDRFELVRPWLRKYSAQGEEEWTESFDDTIRGLAGSVAIGPDLSVTYAGTEERRNVEHLVVHRFEPTGERRWTTRIEANAAQIRCAVDESGAVYVASLGCEGWACLETRKLDAGGAEIWHGRAAPEERTPYQHLDSVVVSRAGDLILSGSVDYQTGPDVWMRKRRSDGLAVWVRHLPRPHRWWPRGLVADATGGTFLLTIGRANPDDTFNVAMLRRYSP